MDTESTKDLAWFWHNLWPSLVVALAIYGGGVTATRVAAIFVPAAKDYLAGKGSDLSLDPSWPLLFRLWAATKLAHPILVGAAIAFIPGLPRPEFVGSQVSAVLWFGLGVGGLNGQIHQIGEAVIRQVMKLVDLIVPWVRSKLGLPAQSVVPAEPKPAPAADREEEKADPMPDPPTDPPMAA